MAYRRTYPPRWARRRYGSTEVPWVPTDIAVGCSVWIEARFITGLSDSDPIGTAPDQSGESHDGTQAVEASKPLFKENILNSYPAMFFDDANDFLTIAGYGLTQPWTAFLLLADANQVASNTVMDGTAINAGRLFRVFNAGDTLQQYAGGYGAYSPVYSQDTFYTVCSVYNGASSQVYLNGSAGTAGNCGATNPNGHNLGCYGTGDGGFWGGYIVGFVACQGVVSEADRALMDTFWKTIYAHYV